MEIFFEWKGKPWMPKYEIISFALNNNNRLKDSETAVVGTAIVKKIKPV